METKMIDEILDLVSSIEPYEEWEKGKIVKKFRRWGHDTDCGENKNIHEKVKEIFAKYDFQED